MKSISSHKSSKRRRILILIILLVLVGLGVGAFYVQKQDQETAERQGIVERDRRGAKTDKSAKKDAMAQDKDHTTHPNIGLPSDSTSTTSNQIPVSSDLSVDITSTSQSSGVVNASATTSGDGTCVFQYSAGDKDKPVTRQVAVSARNCSTSISQNEFSYLGQWKLTVTYYSGGNKAEASQDVTIN